MSKPNSSKSCLRVKSQKESLDTSKKASSKSSTRSKSSLNFKSVEIREYPRIIGDNPSCSGGAPMSIDWAHYPQQYYNIDEFEGAHPSRRKRSEMVMPSDVRHQMLMKDWGCSMKSIVKASQERKEVAELRKKTASQSEFSFKAEERMEKFKNTFRKKNPKPMASSVKSGTSKSKARSADSLDTTMSSSGSSLLLVKS